MRTIRSLLLQTKGPLTRSLSTSVAKRKEIKDWWDSRPKPIKLFPGEKEIFRNGSVLVTDTRITHIDPFDRVLKTYMFEHMISLNKNYYHASIRTRRLCRGLIILSVLILLFTLVVDLMDQGSQQFTLVYIPVLISLIVGLFVWRDMRPKYRVEWYMRDGKQGGIRTEPLMREWLFNNNRREQFMDNLVEAMNQALTGKAWWPHNTSQGDALTVNVRQSAQSNMHGDADNPSRNGDSSRRKKGLTLVTDAYR